MQLAAAGRSLHRRCAAVGLVGRRMFGGHAGRVWLGGIWGARELGGRREYGEGRWRGGCRFRGVRGGDGLRALTSWT